METRARPADRRWARIGLALLALAAVVGTVVAVHDPFGGASPASGYWLVGADGGVFAFGDAAFEGSAASTPLDAPIVGMAATPDARGYWLVASDGGVFSYGNAGFHGSAAMVAKHAPIVGIAADPVGPGYWLVGADGGVYSADAGFYGPTALVPLAAPIVGMAATPDGRGYWLVGADGGIFAFGDARFLGSANGMHLDAPIVAIASTPDGGGYWLSAADGGVFAFGDARFVGSAHGARLSAPIVGMAAGPDGEGYALAAADGGVFAFGDEPYDGSAAPLRPRAKVVGIASGAARAASGGNAFCGSRSGPPATSKLLVIWEENASASSVYGNPAAPHLNTYAQECGRATDYVSLGHPSLPNYLEATSGTAYDQSPWTSDCAAASPGCQTANANIFEQVGPGGWKAYAQSMPSPCDRSDSGPYVARHNPAVYYSDLGAACASNDLNLGSLSAGALESDIAAGTLPVFATLTPDVNNDQHDGTLQEADAFLSSWIDELVAGPDYQSGRLAIAIVYDEGAGSGTDSPSVVPAVFMSQYVQPGTASNVAFTHYSLLAAAEDIAGVPRLGNAATAADLRAAFGF